MSSGLSWFKSLDLTSCLMWSSAGTPSPSISSTPWTLSYDRFNMHQPLYMISLQWQQNSNSRLDNADHDH
ncbi:hypothetical protein TNCV_3734471 [Trichonephila clavipes]|nr:hypothetical protein TNCV_3734471 [Trichonephila clavipes]